MTYKEKVNAYRQLVCDVQNCAKLNDCNKSSSKKAVELEKCPFCYEINLWSYWHGGVNNLDADILLVGQDWGNYHDKKCSDLIEQIKLHSKESERRFSYPTLSSHGI